MRPVQLRAHAHGVCARLGRRLAACDGMQRSRAAWHLCRCVRSSMLVRARHAWSATGCTPHCVAPQNGPHRGVGRSGAHCWFRVAVAVECAERAAAVGLVVKLAKLPAGISKHLFVELAGYDEATHTLSVTQLPDFDNMDICDMGGLVDEATGNNIVESCPAKTMQQLIVHAALCSIDVECGRTEYFTVMHEERSAPVIMQHNTGVNQCLAF